MDNLIEALRIFRKYGNPDYPTHCEHDMLSVHIDEIEQESDVSKEDIKRLDDLGFFWNYETDSFASFKFGSC